jgi:periplasmic protein TonB
MSLLAWDDGFARWLIQRAARNAPPSLSERLEEEWLADLEARRGQMARLRFGFGCCWATRVITQEHCAQKVPAAASATGSKIMTAHAQHDSSFFSRRTTAFLLIVCLHAALIYALVTGLAHRMIEAIPQPMQVAVLQQPRTRNEPPPLPPLPKFSPPRVDEVPKPEIQLDVAPDPDIALNVMAQPQVPLLPRAAAPKVMNRVWGGPGKGFPNTDDYYPSVARRLGEKGIAAVRVCVDDKGRLTADPTLAQSSGSANLDGGALKLARAGSGHYRATTEDGLPVNSCYVFRIRFDLKDY